MSRLERRLRRHNLDGNNSPALYGDYLQWQRGAETHLFTYHLDNRPTSVVLATFETDQYLGNTNPLRPQSVESLYHHVNTFSPVAYCDRTILPNRKLLTGMAGKAYLESIGIPKTKEPKLVKEFDIVGISLVNPLQIYDLFDFLHLSGIPLLSGDRQETDPLIICGGVAMGNPLPYKPFIDVAVIGHGEEVLLEIAKRWQESKGLPRWQRITQLSDIEGVYLSAYPVEEVIQATLRYAEAHYLAGSAIVQKGTGSILLARSCPNSCHFCQHSGMEGYQVKPFSQLIDHLDRLKIAGTKKVSLLAASASMYKYGDYRIDAVVGAVRDRGMMPTYLSDRPEDWEKTRRFETTKTIVLAPEASPRIRAGILGKTIREEDLQRTIDFALDNGVETFSLNCIIGVVGDSKRQGETAEDINYLADLGRTIAENGQVKGVPINVKLNVMPLIPSPHTLLETVRMVSWEDYRQRLQYLKEAAEGNPSVKVQPVVDKSTYLTEALMMGGEEKAGVICFEAYNLQKKEGVPLEVALEMTMEKHGVSFDNIFREYTKDELPYRFIKTRQLPRRAIIFS